MNLQDAHWYQSFIEECRDILVEHGTTARWALIEGYHKLGQRILEEHENFQKHKIYGKRVIKKIADSLGKNERSIYYCIAFVNKFPDLAMLPEGKETTWRDIVHKHLPELTHNSDEKDVNPMLCLNVDCPNRKREVK